VTPIVISLPLRLESVANLREHWTARHRRAKQHRFIAKCAVRVHVNQPWADRLDVLLVRIAPRALDSHDNLRISCKGVVDGVADALGVDDRDPRVTWRYEQEKPPKGAKKAERHGLRIELRAGAEEHTSE
jgi:hypothetical protein